MMNIERVCKKISLSSLMACFLILSGALSSWGQSTRFDANFYVSQKTFGKNSAPKYGQVKYEVLNTYKMAADYAEQLKAAIKKDNEPGTSGNALEKAVAHLPHALRDSRSNGTFTVHVEDGMGVLILGDDGAEAVAVKAGQTDYRVLVHGVASIEISEVDVYGKRKIPVFRKIPSTDTGYEVSFNINAYLEKGICNTHCRLMAQPVVVDCQTDDTIAYLKPLVYEGLRYHDLQDRRMGFDYLKNDPVAVGYHPTPLLSDDRPFQLDTNVVFRKPDKDKSYKCSYFLTVEDYTHKIFDNGGEGTGSCLAYRPFKFLDFKVAAAELPLTAEFYDQAESRVRDVPRDLLLRFVVGTDQLTRDSLNDIVLNNLTKEMRSYGDRLTQISIEGAASPDGRSDLNLILARKRAATAQRMLRERLGHHADYVRLPSPSVRVYTWGDVAGTLEQKDSAAVAADLRSIIASKGEEGTYAVVRQRPYYSSAVIPVLESERVMKCSYQYEIDHVMDASEAVEEYMSHRDDYVKGRRDLSDGDYYHLFEALTDSAEQDQLTETAYRHVVRQPAYWLLKIAPYVANRKALLNIRKGIYDPSVLRPFIDFSLNQTDSRDASTGMIRNRKALMINQAITYFQDQKLDTAQFLIDRLKATGDARVERVEKFVTFVREFFAVNKSPEFNAAYDYVLNSSPDNKAVLYSELRNQLGKTRAEAEEYVDRMPDNSAKKWYLKGILWSDAAGQEPSLTGNSTFQRLTDFQIIELQQSNPDSLKRYEEAEKAYDIEEAKVRGLHVPWYLAFFQHSFDLEPKYARLYFNEGNVSDDQRRQYPYRPKDIGNYRKMFQLIMQRRK
ncbi:hypothetical protein [Prevotella sp. AGR2160]|uniref:hypothetical protein n=1 Tax=Prevotella sp. AGR2160 TaxID=1280674 RepID=UPI0012DF4D57|nr:hypothetical protein [Prevotella sp. AGR2160]